jgi:chromosome partitioning protein
MIIAVSNLKGGAGKTTSAVYLAAAGLEQGYRSVLVIDADRQGSAAEWLEEQPLDGVEVLEAPSERTLAKALSRRKGLKIVDTPPGDQRLQTTALAKADAVVIPTRAGGVEIAPVAQTLELVPERTPRGVVLCSARLGTNDLEETIAFWRRERVPVWGVVPERVGIASGPEARLHREGLEHYGEILKRLARSAR